MQRINKMFVVPAESCNDDWPYDRNRSLPVEILSDVKCANRAGSISSSSSSVAAAVAAAAVGLEVEAEAAADLTAPAEDMGAAYNSGTTAMSEVPAMSCAPPKCRVETNKTELPSAANVACCSLAAAPNTVLTAAMTTFPNTHVHVRTHTHTHTHTPIQ
jgi:hypothetical protein